MVQINFAQKQINAKIVYYGPGMSGKTTNLEVIHQRAPAPNRGDLTSISTDGDRTLFFDYMPLDLGTVAGMRTCFQVYTVPGQVYYNSTRKLVLQGVDGVIFIADSSEKMREQNIESLKNLEENLAEYGKNIANLPLVIQYNKRDLPNAVSLETLEADLNHYGVPSFEAVANTGQGVFPTLKALAAVVLRNLSKEHSIGGSPVPAPPRPQAATPPSLPPPMPIGHTAPAAPAAQQTRAPAPQQRPSAPPHAAPMHASAGGPISVPLSETRMTPRGAAMPPGAAPRAPLQMDVNTAPFAGHAAAAQQPLHATSHGHVATAPAMRPKAPQVVAGSPKPAAAPRTRRVTQAQPAEAPTGKRGGMLFTGAFIVLATAVGAALAKAILSVL